jgi:hypothetical protein
MGEELKTVIDCKKGVFVDQACKFSFQGRTFEAGGAWICQEKKSGRLRGLVYVNETERTVSNWHGTIKLPARFGPVWRSNMGDKRRSVYFEWAGHLMFGVLCSLDFNQAVKVREIGRVRT